MMKIPLFFIFLCILSFLNICPAHSGGANSLPDDDTALRCILGEAESESLTGMIAVAEAIRNRGHIRGVYGCKAVSNVANRHFRGRRPIPDYVVQNARDAWLLSKATAITGGATHWESIDFKTPKWASAMIVTLRLGKHVFYKENNLSKRK